MTNSNKLWDWITAFLVLWTVIEFSILGTMVFMLWWNTPRLQPEHRRDSTPQPPTKWVSSGTLGLTSYTASDLLGV